MTTNAVAVAARYAGTDNPAATLGALREEIDRMIAEIPETEHFVFVAAMVRPERIALYFNNPNTSKEI